MEDVAGGDDQGARGQRVRRDVADRVSLHPPGQDRPLVGEVVAGGADRGGGDEPVAADVADLLAGEPVAELGDAVVRAAGEGDVVEADPGLALERDLQPRQLDRLDLAGEGAADPCSASSRSTAARKPTVPKLTPKTGTPVRAKRRSACRIEPSPPRTRQMSGRGSSPATTSMPSAASPCLASSSAVATRRQPASRGDR